jgi:acetyl esterase/lipase
MNTQQSSRAFAVKHGLRPHLGKSAWRSAPKAPSGLSVRVLLDIPYAGNDEDKNKLDLYLPDRRTFPVVVFAHGGGWDSGDKAPHGYLGTFLARHGIGAALVNYRLAPQVRNPDQAARDLARAFAWSWEYVRDYGGDRDRLFLAGHSAGGHLASLLGTNGSYLAAENMSLEHVRGIASISGIYNISWTISLYRLGYLLRHTDKAALSPHCNVHAGCPPFLIVHAQKEVWTLRGQARRFHRKLLAQQCRSRLVMAPGEDHYTIIANAALPSASHGKEIVRFVHEV